MVNRINNNYRLPIFNWLVALGAGVEDRMKAKWAIGLSIVIACLLIGGGMLLNRRQGAGSPEVRLPEVKPHVAGGYGEEHLYIDPDWELWVDVRAMQDGGGIISVDDAGASLSMDFAGIVPEVVYATDEDSARLGLVTNARIQLWNRIVTDEDGSFDLERNNCEETLLASASRTTTTNSMPQTNYNGSRLLLIVDVSAINASPIVTPTLQVRDPGTSNYFTVWTAGTGLTGVATTAYYFADGASGGSFTEILAFGLPSRIWRARMVHHDTDAITYTVGSVVSIH